MLTGYHRPKTMPLREKNAPYRGLNKDLRKIFIYKVNGGPDLSFRGLENGPFFDLPGEREPAVLY
jgi:hypothetical protein